MTTLTDFASTSAALVSEYVALQAQAAALLANVAALKSDLLAMTTFDQMLAVKFGATEVWSLVDINSETIPARVDAGCNGRVAGWTPNHAEVLPERKAPFLDGATGYGDIFTTSLRGKFNGREGSAVILCRMSHDGVMRDSIRRTLLMLGAGSRNLIQLRRGTTDNTLQLLYKEANVNRALSYTFTTPPQGWTMIGVDWSATAKIIRMMINGVEVATFPIAGTFEPVALTTALIGAETTQGVNVHSGWLAYAALRCGAHWTEADFAAQYASYQMYITRPLIPPTLEPVELIVTTLNDHGAGSLRAGCMQARPAAISFAVAGEIVLTAPIDCYTPGIKIDGSTAPGAVVLKQYGIRSFADDFGLRFLRIRPGIPPVPETAQRCLAAAGANAVIEYNSFAWCTDDSVALTGYHPTFRYNIIAEALRHANKPDGPAGYGMNIWAGADGADVHHNLIALNYFRNPKIRSDGGCVRFANNVVYACAFYTVIDGRPDFVQHLDLLANFYKQPAGMTEYEIYADGSDAPEQNRVYLSGNIGVHRPTDELPETAITNAATLARITLLSAPNQPLPAYLVTAAEAYADVLANVGATLPLRDSTDCRIIQHVINGTGAIVDAPPEGA